MFDISFAELMMVAVVGLLVIGPEKLPKVARTLGAYTGRLQRYVSQVKEEVNREVRFEELQALQQELKEGADQVKASIRDGEQSIKKAASGIAEDVNPKRRTAAKKSSINKAKAPVKKAAPQKAGVKKAATKKASGNRTSAKKTTTRKPAVKKAVTKPVVDKAEV